MKNILLFVTVTALFTTILGADPGNHYAFAQEGAITPEGSVNDTMSGQNASQWATNATLVFAQADDTEMNQGQGNDTSAIQSQSSGAKNDGNNEEEEGDDE